MQHPAAVVQPSPVIEDNPFLDAPVNGAQEAAPDSPPTAEELIIIDGWISPPAAQKWIIDHGLATNEFSARNAWMAAVKACGGYNNQNAAQVKLTYLRERMVKHGAPTAVSLASVPELAH